MVTGKAVALAVISEQTILVGDDAAERSEPEATSTVLYDGLDVTIRGGRDLRQVAVKDEIAKPPPP